MKAFLTDRDVLEELAHKRDVAADEVAGGLEQHFPEDLADWIATEKALTVVLDSASGERMPRAIAIANEVQAAHVANELANAANIWHKQDPPLSRKIVKLVRGIEAAFGLPAHDGFTGVRLS